MEPERAKEAASLLSVINCPLQKLSRNARRGGGGEGREIEALFVQNVHRRPNKGLAEESRRVRCKCTDRSRVVVRSLRTRLRLALLYAKDLYLPFDRLCCHFRVSTSISFDQWQRTARGKRSVESYRVIRTMLSLIAKERGRRRVMQSSN